MKRIRNWFIGDYLAKTDNVFEQAKIKLLYNFTVFYLLSLIPFYGNLLANGYTYHAIIITFAILMLLAILASFKIGKEFGFIAKILFVQQNITGILSFLIQESKMDFVGEFWIVVNIMVAFFTLGRNFGFAMAAIWFLQLVHCLVNELSGGKYILIHMPADQVLPPAPLFVLVPFFLCIYIISQFVKTRSIAESDIQQQKHNVEHKNKEIMDSIRYAQRIQISLLPTEKFIDRIFKNRTHK